MGKKNKSNNNNIQPNAPELQQILLDSPSVNHPPHNPYYPNLTSESMTHYVPPPPYSDLSVPKGKLTASNSVPMTIIQQAPAGSLPTGGRNHHHQYQDHRSPPTVIVQQPTTITIHDRKREKFNRKIRSFNNQMTFVALLIVVLSVYASSLFIERPCVKSFIVHQPTKDIAISVEDVYQAQRLVAYASLVVFGICIAKCGRSHANSHGCYLFTIILATFVLTVATGYLAYLAFYSPCTRNMGQIGQSAAKSLFSNIIKDMPDSVREYFNEGNVFTWSAEDKKGVYIFFIDSVNFVLYLSAFLSALSLS